MSERFFDDLARALASPMPRRRALRLAGAALVAATVPGVRPHSASARTRSAGTPCESLCTATPGYKPCGITGKNAYGETNCYMAGCYDPKVDKCCYIGKHSDTEPGVYICSNDSRCGTVESLKKEGKSCIRECTRCGNDCCTEDEACVSPKRSLCCKKGEGGAAPIPCLVPKSPEGTCCKPGTECKINPTGTAAKCCHPSQVLRSGRCTCADPKQQCGDTCCDAKQGKVCSKGVCCPKGKTGCGDTDCCEKNEVCSKGKCCPKGKVNCGDKCCAPVDCCRKTCCEGDSVCANGTCCPPGRGFGKGPRARCCPPGTVPTNSGINGGCCPPNDPACCDVASDVGEVACPIGKTCVAGVCTKL